jgi:urease accessory protein
MACCHFNINDKSYIQERLRLGYNHSLAMRADRFAEYAALLNLARSAQIKTLAVSRDNPWYGVIQRSKKVRNISCSPRSSMVDLRPGDRGIALPVAVRSSNRSQGVVDLSFRRRLHATVADRTFQSGCLRVRLPRCENHDQVPCAVLINTAGGVAEGDRLDQRIAWGEDTAATVTTQAAEKIYRALAQGSAISTQLTVAAGADAEWLPQETILFDAARLRRDARIVLAGDVTFLGLEAVVLGRTAMGEAVRSGGLRDRMRIWLNGRLIYADTLALEGDVATLMQRSAIGGGAKGMAVIVHASAQAKTLLGPVRDALEGAAGLAAASTWNGLLAVRLLAPDGETLRHDITLALAALREGRSLPRVWRC